jgi:hypothetical protein
MNIDKIVSIAGKPGIFEIKSQTKGGIIVESLQDKKRFPVNSLQSISALSDIAIYTYEEEIPLREVLLNMYKKENGAAALDHTSDAKKLKEYFAEVLPNYDEERVYTSNIKKVVQWYNILVSAGFDFTSLEEKEEEETK